MLKIAMNHLNLIKRGGKRGRATRMRRKYIVAYRTVVFLASNLELNSAFEYESKSRDDSNIDSSALSKGFKKKISENLANMNLDNNMNRAEIINFDEDEFSISIRI